MSIVSDRIRVLHVNDERGFAASTGQFLERADDRLTVRTDTGAAEGQKALSGGGIDCVVSDDEMPGQNGSSSSRASGQRIPTSPFSCSRAGAARRSRG